MKKFSTMEQDDSIQYKNRRNIKLKRRTFYVLIFLLLLVPVIVGVLVWYLMPKCSESTNISGEAGKVTGDEATTPAPSEPEPWKNLRLPDYIIPVHYDITLYPDFYDDHGWFYGNASVEIKISKETSYVLIHFNYMNITKTVLRNNGTGQEIKIRRHFAYAENQFWVVETETPVPSGSVVKLEIQYDGSLTRSIVGLYKSRYVNSITGEVRYLATSKFQPVDARRAFPCFDEPNFKAQYTVHLVHRPGYISLSNMPNTSTESWAHDQNLLMTNFERSVDMSTYLVCFIICDFQYLETKTIHGTPVRVFATPDRVNQTEFSLKVAVESMELYQELFGVPYPLPKQDMIAIPDFVSGAMEHWGLITYREVNMLFDPKEASPANQQRVAAVVAHEIAHMWFGNIVTNDWWDDLWLNEGFASYMEYLGVNKTEPEWRMVVVAFKHFRVRAGNSSKDYPTGIVLLPRLVFVSVIAIIIKMEHFITDDLQPVMVTDAGKESHPIIVDVTHPDQINEVFDSISYSKGASVIRMLQNIMGKAKFFTGIGKYLEKYKWSNAKTDDLWTELGQADVSADLSVKEVMDTWTRQMGLPYVTIDIIGNKVKATQKRFLADGSTSFNITESPYRYKWWIYLDYVTDSGSRGHHWISKDQDTIEFNLDRNILTTQNSWVKFNIGQSGFYRVNYPNIIWERFSNMLKIQGPSALGNEEKSSLVDDAMSLARAGYLDYDLALGVTSYLDQENNYLPWKTSYRALQYISDMFRKSGLFGYWRNYVISKSKPALERLGWDDTGSHLQRLMRTYLIQLTCSHAESDCLRNATQIFRHWIEDKASIPPNTRSYVYRYGMQNGGTEEDWNKMWQKYTSETVPQEQVKLLYGMAHTTNIWLLTRYLNYAKNESLVRSQDFFTVLTYISDNPVGNSVVWDWIRQNWEYLVDRFTLYSRSLGRLTPRVVNKFNTEFHLQEVQEFFTKYPDAGAGERGRKQALESVRRNIDWMSRYSGTITKWLCSQPDLPAC